MKNTNKDNKSLPKVVDGKKALFIYVWEWIGNNNASLNVIISFLLMISAGLSLIFVLFQLRDLREQNINISKQTKDISDQTSILIEQNILIERSFTEQYRPIGSIVDLLDTLKTKPGYPKGNAEERLYSFNSMNFNLHNKGSGVLRFVGAITYLTIDNNDPTQDIRKDLIECKLDTTKIGTDFEFMSTRGRVVVPHDSTEVTVGWREINYRPMLWLQLYVIIFYQDINNNLYDTTHLFTARYLSHITLSTKGMILYSPSETERFYRYTDDEKNKIKSYYDKIKHPMFLFID